MKRYRPELSVADRKTWRQWKAWSICIYIVIIGALMGIGSLVPRSSDTESVHSASIDQISLSKKTGLSARVSPD
jgi:hypothetical protein